MRYTLLLAGLLVLGLCMRLFWIDRVPVGISHDELDYVLGGTFLGLTGSDMTGTWKWWELKPMQTGTLTAELTPFYFVPAGLLFGQSLFAAKITPALIGVLTGLLVYLLMLRLTRRNYGVSLLCAALFIINPWNFILSRTGYEVSFATFWYLLSVTAYVYLDPGKIVARRNVFLLLLSLSAFFLGYFSYHGFKFLAPFIAWATIIGSFYTKHRQIALTKQIVPISLYGLLPMALLLFSLVNYSAYGDRTGEIGMFGVDRYSSAVNDFRRLSIENNLTPLLINKYSLYVRQLATTYLQFFSLERLFLTTNDSYNLNFPNHGYFYLIEIFFIPLGVWVAIKDKRLWILILLLLVAPIPSLVHSGVSYMIRSSFAMVPLACLSGLGMHALLSRLKHRSLQIVTVAAVVMSLLYFQFLYYSSYSILSADQYMLDYRLVSSYIHRSLPKANIIVGGEFPYHLFRDYLFFADKYRSGQLREYQDQFGRGLYASYSLPHVEITSDCNLVVSPPAQTVIVGDSFYTSCLASLRNSDADFDSPLEMRPALSIGSPIDGRQYYRVFDPSICIEGRASGFIHIKKMSQLAIETMSDKDFCSSWTF